MSTDDTAIDPGAIETARVLSEDAIAAAIKRLAMFVGRKREGEPECRWQARRRLRPFAANAWLRRLRTAGRGKAARSGGIALAGFTLRVVSQQAVDVQTAFGEAMRWLQPLHDHLPVAGLSV